MGEHSEDMVETCKEISRLFPRAQHYFQSDRFKLQYYAPKGKIGLFGAALLSNDTGSQTGENTP